VGGTLRIGDSSVLQEQEWGEKIAPPKKQEVKKSALASCRAKDHWTAGLLFDKFRNVLRFDVESLLSQFLVPCKTDQTGGQQHSDPTISTELFKNVFSG